MCLSSQGPNLFFGSSIQYSWGTLLCLTGIRLILYWPLDFVWSRYKRLIDWGVGSLNCFWDVSLVCIKWDVCLVGVSGWHREMCEMCDSDMCLWLTLCLWHRAQPWLSSLLQCLRVIQYLGWFWPEHRLLLRFYPISSWGFLFSLYFWISAKHCLIEYFRHTGLVKNLSKLTKYYQVGINNHSPKWLHCIRLPSSAAAFSSQL